MVVDDNARIEHRDGGSYSPWSDGAHRMRGDGVGVRDVSAVSCEARRRRDKAGGDDGRGAGRERKSGLVFGFRRTE
jgi:hypothetical protein